LLLSSSCDEQLRGGRRIIDDVPSIRLTILFSTNPEVCRDVNEWVVIPIKPRLYGVLEVEKPDAVPDPVTRSRR
jgi:hypothetical protein